MKKLSRISKKKLWSPVKTVAENLSMK